MSKFLTIHGHFYQPPRDNPYLEKIEIQESAYPYHDWNERINKECYQPNTCSRVLNRSGKIVDIVNNFEYISFNIGPTLLSWLMENDKVTYNRIIEADVKSRERNNGHGNAIAQVFNHIIMPLASLEDKITQIRWGIEDFKKHFGREPEGMWLAETAINYATARVLIDNGIKFTVLSPFQAEKTKSYFSNTWLDVSNGTIDPTQPYRVFVDDTRTKYLDVFFYDAPISSAVSFEHLLRDASGFANRLNQAAQPNEGRPMLVNISTDGESYGHHEPFGDMCLAYFCKKLAKDFNFQLMNYANFLSMYQPISEVVLKGGNNDEGTAWSCSHGVGRWKEDCGCSTGARSGWNQKWRKPLREGLDVLRDKLMDLYLKETKSILQDPLEARNAYYSFFSGQISFSKFLKDYGKKESISYEAERKLRTLLEVQRFSQLMYTSCGWFFADISGIETVQIIKYANIAIRYAKQYTDEDLEKPFVGFLKEAKSNMGEGFHGDQIYNKWIKPYELDATKAINQFMIEGVLFGIIKPRQIYLYDIQPEKETEFKINDSRYLLVNFKTEHLRTKNSFKVTALICEKEDELKTYLSWDYYNNIRDIVKQLSSEENKKKRASLMKRFFPVQISLQDLNYEESSEIMQFLWEKKYKNIVTALNKIFYKFEDLLRSTILMGGFLPAEIKKVLEIIMSAKYNGEIRKIDDFKISNFEEVISVVNIAKQLNIQLDKSRSQKYLEGILQELVNEIEENKTKISIEKAKLFLEVVDHLDISLNRTQAENQIFKFYQDCCKGKENPEWKKKKEFLKLVEMFNIEVN